jgi:NADPH:quinone reductase-like Zn-dependent oxidoreductase
MLTALMRLITLESFDSGPSLREVLTSEGAPNEALIRVHAASINAIDVITVAGALRGMMD